MVVVTPPAGACDVAAALGNAVSGRGQCCGQEVDLHDMVVAGGLAGVVQY